MHKTTVARGRQAFTLVELLVVISIIGLMTGLIVAGTMKFKDAARTHAADAQVAKYQRALETEYNAIVQRCLKEGPPDAVTTYCGDNKDRARAVHTAATLRVNFPETFAEALAAPLNIGGHMYYAKNTFASVSGATASTEQQQAVLLYLIVKERSNIGGTGDATSTPGEEQSLTLGSKNFTVLVDSYGTPLVFSRWIQTGELDFPPYVAASAGTNKDPLDPKGLVASWSETAKRDALNTGSLSLGFANRNRAPTVISYGKDKRYDYFVPKGGQLPTPPYATGDLSNEDDRIGYRLSRFGAKGDGK